MSRMEKRLYEFGPFRLEPTEHTLLRDGSPVPLRPKVFDILLLLVERHGHLVGKDELIRLVWPEQFVEEGNLNKTISMLRQALGESETAERYIETVPKRGYRFVADVRVVDSASRPEGLPEPASRPEEARKRQRPIPRLRPALFYLALAVIATIGALTYISHSATDAGGAIDSVAVMPFLNDSHDPSAEYLSDGITESLISSLSQLGNLKVMSRNTVFRFKGQQVDAQQTAKTLGVRSMLMGNVKQLGGQLTIGVELIDARDGSVIWSHQYIRETADVIALQTSVAKDIAENLRLKLSGAQQQQLGRRSTDNPQAYEVYLKGRYFWNKNRRTPEDFQKSREYYQRAIDLDPTFALAYVGLANCYNQQTLYSEVPSTESVPLARIALTKALKLDDALSEAHASLAWTKFAYDWDWIGAESELQRAIQLNPNLAIAYNTYGAVLTSLGRFDEGIAKKRAALELDPLSSPMRASACWMLYFARRYDAALAECGETLAMEEGFYRAHLYRGLAYEQKGQYEQAIAELDKALSLAPGSGEVLSAMAHVYAMSGNRAKAQQIMSELNAGSKERHVDPYGLALIYAGLGQNDRAFEWLNRAFEARRIMLVWLKVEPRLDPIRSDSRYQDLVRRVGFPE